MATRTISNAGGNYNDIAAWVEGAVPNNTDDVVATGTSGNLTVNVASNAKTFNLTNYVGLLTMNNTLTVAGAITLVNTCTYAGTSDLIATTTATHTATGVTFTGGLRIQGTAQTHTLGSNWIINGVLTVVSGSPILNSNQISCNGLLMQASSGTGNSKVVLTGGTWSGNFQTWFDIDFAGNVTVSGLVQFGSQASSIRTLKYVSGTITTTGSTVTISGNNVTIDTNGMSWNNISLTNSVTTSSFTLNSLLTIGGIFTTTSRAATYTLTFAGTAGMTAHTWKIYGASTAGQTTTINLRTGVGFTYTVTNVLDLDGIVGTLSFKSTSAGTKAKFNVQSGCVQTVAKCTVQDIDSSGGDTVLNLNGTISNTTNWITTPASGGTVSSGYVN